MDGPRGKMIGNIEKIYSTRTHYCIEYGTGEEACLYILNEHVLRYYMSPTKNFQKYPTPVNEDDVATIVIKDMDEYGCEVYWQSQLDETDTHYIIKTNEIQISFDKIKATMKIHDIRTDKEVLCEAEALSYEDNRSKQTLYQRDNEYFFGGGMQNGRFSHKGECIDIVTTSKWTDGGVSSPCPFYWSTNGYGILRNTWQKGWYDFGTKSNELINTIHLGEDFDAFIFVNPLPKDILRDYYELTGKPLLLPEYALYEAHFNAFNRDYWVQVEAHVAGAILFEDGKHYKCFKPKDIGDVEGILESLNGENDNYQFSARAMIDRYKKHDMPLGWFIPNDGYGSGYGQASTFEGDIQNLKGFSEYCSENGVKLALWTESKLQPDDPSNPQKGERDLKKEITEANVVALKCDEAWIGSGYSFGLSAVQNAAILFMKETCNEVRPMIITVNGWAGTQRCAGIWSGDQHGGEWEYIRFHIPTYVGSGLSGQPIVGSDMDGIYAGGNREINIRDYQWKTFTPLQLNMDGWGNTPKTPFSYDEEATTINRAYLKLKSMLMPYNYTIAHESINGLPMVRAVFLEFPQETTAHTIDSQYQFMWGPNILVAPIYNGMTLENDSLRNGIYLPDKNQVWIDFYTGEKYEGGKIYNNIIVPLWKIPVFIREGCIIPMTNPNNNPSEIDRAKRIFTLYPFKQETFTVYEDDGISLDYQDGHCATTDISVEKNTENLLIRIKKTIGSYKSMTKERSTQIQIVASRNIESIKAVVNGEPLEITEATNSEEFENHDNCYYFDEEYSINPYLSEYNVTQKCLLIKIPKVDVTESEIVIKVRGYENESSVFGNTEEINSEIALPSDFAEYGATPTNITLKWEARDDIDYYEIEKDSTIIYSNIKGNTFEFDGFKFNTKHNFRIRAIVGDCASDWSDILEASTQDDPFENLILGVEAICNLPCQPQQEVANLVDPKSNLTWHTRWGEDGQANPGEQQYLRLLFDLGDIYELNEIKYLPREDAGNGTFLTVQYRHSIDKNNWSPESEPIEYLCDNTVKTISMNGSRMRYIEFILLSTVGDFGSGRAMLFYKK